MDEELSTSKPDIMSSPMASPVTGSSRSDGGVNVYNGQTEEPYVGSSISVSGNKDPDPLANHSSFDFAKEIRRLEIEGNKLRAATMSTLANIGKFSKIDLLGIP